MEKNIPLTWISERMDMSCERLETLLKGKVHGAVNNRYVPGFEFFQWFFNYTPEVITDQYREFWMECNDILYKSMKQKPSYPQNAN